MGRRKKEDSKYENKKYRNIHLDEVEENDGFFYEMKKEIIGITTIAVSAILALSVFYNVDSDTLLAPLHELMNFLFGWFALIFPVIIIIRTVMILNNDEKEFDARFLLVMLFVLGIISSYPSLAAGEDFAMAQGYGGILGASFSWCLYHMAGKVGGYIILVAISAVTFMLLTRKSVVKIVKKGANAAADSARHTREAIENRMLMAQEEYGYDEEVEEEIISNKTKQRDFDIRIDAKECDDEDEFDEEDDEENEDEHEEGKVPSVFINLDEEKSPKKSFFRALRMPGKRREEEEKQEYKSTIQMHRNEPIIELFGVNESKEDMQKILRQKNDGVVDLGIWENGNYVSNSDRLSVMSSSNADMNKFDMKNVLEQDHNDGYDEEDEFEDEEFFEEDFIDEEEIDDTKEIELDFLPNNASKIVNGKVRYENPNNEESLNIVKSKTLGARRTMQITTDEGVEQVVIQEEHKPYVYPTMDLLKKPPVKKGGNTSKELKANAEILESTLQSFGVKAKVLDVTKGPAVTRYELQPERGVKVSKIINLADDIALNLAATGVRIAPVPGKAAIGIEVANKETTPVYIREVLDTNEFSDSESKLSVCLGKGIDGKTVVIDIAKMPHLLIAGATGSGKSVCINSIISSIIYKSTPEEVKLLMVDPKVVELKMYTGIPHLLIPVVTDPKKAASALNWAVVEMEERYKFFAENSVKDLKGYNVAMKKAEKHPLPQIVIVIDELADLMMTCRNEIEESICRLAQKARAAGIHLIIATQRPSVDVITGLIKANVPSRIAFAVSSAIDSRTILDMTGAEKLLGKGDMLYFPVGASKPARIQGAFVSETEVEAVVDFIKEHYEVEYDPEVISEITEKNSKQAMDAANSSGDEDEYLIEDAIDLIREKKKASISMFQRAFKIGFNKAARLMEQLEDKGIVGPEDGTKPRKVYLDMVNYDD